MSLLISLLEARSPHFTLHIFRNNDVESYPCHTWPELYEAYHRWQRFAQSITWHHGNTGLAILINQRYIEIDTPDVGILRDIRRSILNNNYDDIRARISC